MCGIVGVITKNKYGFNKAEQKMFYELLYAGVFRGADATGVITCHNTQDFGIMKEASDSSVFSPQFIGSDLDKDLFKNGTTVIGHNRAKTIGDHSDENAHPFVVDGTFAMVHNGTLRNHKKLEDTAVDSEALAITFKKAMDEEDFQQAISEAVWKVEGAFACVWYDQKRNQVGMVRNNQRPLAMIEYHGCILFGSEIGLLNWIGGRNNGTQVSHQFIQENTLYLFDMNKMGGAVETFPLSSKPVVIAAPKTSTPKGITDVVTQLFRKPADGAPTKCSKNAFKRFKRQLLRKYLTFNLDDWVEKQINVEGDEYILLGSVINGGYDLCEVSHMVRGLVDIRKLGISVKEMDFQSEWIGCVRDVIYDQKIGQLIIDVSQIVPVKEEVILGTVNETKH